ncbi:MAG: hypothetical protein AAGF31_00490 [Planctomycetota bacterium]
MKFVGGKPLFVDGKAALADQDDCCCDGGPCDPENAVIETSGLTPLTARGGISDADEMSVSIPVAALPVGYSGTFDTNISFGGHYTDASQTAIEKAAEAYDTGVNDLSPPYPLGIFSSINFPLSSGGNITGVLLSPTAATTGLRFVIRRLIYDTGVFCGYHYYAGSYTGLCGAIVPLGLSGFYLAAGESATVSDIQQRTQVVPQLQIDSTYIYTPSGASGSCGIDADGLPKTYQGTFVADGNAGGTAGTLEDHKYFASRDYDVRGNCGGTASCPANQSDSLVTNIDSVSILDYGLVGRFEPRAEFGWLSSRLTGRANGDAFAVPFATPPFGHQCDFNNLSRSGNVQINLLAVGYEQPFTLSCSDSVSFQIVNGRGDLSSTFSALG